MTTTDPRDREGVSGEMIEPVNEEGIDQQRLAEQLLAQAKEQGIDLVGPDGLLNQLTKNVPETALEAEMDDHLGYERHDPVGRNSGNSRNGTRTKTVLTEIGPVEIDVPRDTDASFDPKIVRKRQRCLDGIDEIVLSLTARGLTTGEVDAHFDEVYGAKVSKETISKITDKAVDQMAERSSRPLDPIYPVIFVDALVIKVRFIFTITLYVVLGAFIDGLSLMLVTLPVIPPLVYHVGMDPYIFGILLFLMIELGQITPPMGVDLFVLKSMQPDTAIGEIFKAVLPICAIIILVAIIIFFVSEVALYLPDSMKD